MTTAFLLLVGGAIVGTVSALINAWRIRSAGLAARRERDDIMMMFNEREKGFEFVKGSRITPTHTIVQLSPFEEWWEKKFHRDRWRARLDMDVAWMDHDTNSIHHVAIGPEECIFCPEPEDPNLTFVGMLSDAGVTAPIIRTEPALPYPDGSLIIEADGMKEPIVIEPEPPRPSEEELAALHRYVDAAPFMTYNEGDEIHEKNARGDVLVSYQEPGWVSCQICSSRKLHRHDQFEFMDQPPLPLELDIPEYDMVG